MQLTRDILLDEESRMLSESVADFREQVLVEKARDLDEEATSGVVEEAFKRTASLGLTGALVSEEAGGQGMDSFPSALLWRKWPRDRPGSLRSCFLTTWR